VEIQLKPKKRQSVKFGVGYGNEDGLRLSGAWTYRNPLSRAGRLSVSARRSEILQTIFASYQQPYVFDAKTTLGSNAGFNRDILDSYNSRNIFANATFQRRFKSYWNGRLGYNLEMSTLEDLKLAVPEEIKQAQEENEFLISSVKFGVFRNTVDNDLDPTTGSFASFSLESASRIIGSELTFLQSAVEVKKYLPLRRKLVLAGRFRLEGIKETEDTDSIPVFKRLFLGGTNTVRGYGFQKLGPLDATGKPVGGRTAFLGNLEIRYPVYKKFSGVAFLDIGQVNPSSFTVNTDDMRFTCGAGIRYDTIVGPLRLDLGYKINPPKFGDVADTPTPDEEIEDRWKIHFSIGQAF
jgi:outer membrane protein assembly factor BamA